MPVTRDNQAVIISIIDHFSRYCWLHSAADQKATTLAEKIFLSISQGGCPQILSSDLGKNLIGQIIQEA